MRNGVPACVAIAAMLPALLFPGIDPARAAGVYEDAAGYASFLTSPNTPSIRAAVVRTEADGPGDASVFVVSVAYPLRGNLLIQAEQPYVSLLEPSDIESGFGDAAVRARLTVAGGGGRAFHILGGLRLGTGTRNLFPYASQSTDLAIGVGYVDTLRVVHVWASAAGVAVNRVPDVLEDRHENFARVVAGTTVPLGTAASLRAGATVLYFRSDAVRDIILAELLLRPSSDLTLHIGAQAETGALGDDPEHVSDVSATAGITARF